MVLLGGLKRVICRGADATAPIALILHPEPDRGGNMNNRVSFAMYKLFQARAGFR